MSIQGPTILLHSGTYFNFLNPEAADITIQDVAQGLSHICRFTGQLQKFYSVGQHSVHCSYLVPPEDAYAALMHDMAEAVIGDVAKPLKQILPDYQALEEKIEAALFKKFKVPNPLPPSVKKADLIMLRTEKEQLRQCMDEWITDLGVEAADFKIPSWLPWEARNMFMMRYQELRPVVV